MTNVINFPISKLMHYAEEFAEAENHVCAFCYVDGEFSQDRAEALIEAAGYVLSVAIGEDAAVEKIRDSIDLIQYMNSGDAP